MIIVRYADDIIVGFQHEADARRFREAMRERLGEFALSLHPDKTRLIEFGRLAAANRERRGLGKPETFHFLGFTFICGKSRAGKFLIHRKSRRDRMRAKLLEMTYAPAAQPEGQDDSAADGAAGPRLSPQTDHPSPLAQRPLRRHTPEVGAVCLNWACTDLCGGRSAMGVPTAIKSLARLEALPRPSLSRQEAERGELHHDGNGAPAL
jgi:RNA-directed DNA polymerase